MTESKEFIKVTEIDFGEVGPRDVLDFVIPWNGDEDDFLYVNKGCGCTQAEFDRQTKTIKGTLNIGLTGFTSEKNMVTKGITIFANDGRDQYMANEKGVMVPNPKKIKYYVQFLAEVVTNK